MNFDRLLKALIRKLLANLCSFGRDKNMDGNDSYIGLYLSSTDTNKQCMFMNYVYSTYVDIILIYFREMHL